MLSYFKKTAFLAVIMGLAAFFFNVLLAILMTILGAMTNLLSGGSGDDGGSGSFQIVRSLGGLLGTIIFIVLLILLFRFIGAKFLAQKTLKGTMGAIAKAPYKMAANTGRNGMNFLRGMTRDLSSRNLQRMAFNQMLGGPGKNAAMKALRTKDQLGILKDVTKAGEDGKVRRKNLKDLKKEGITPKDTRDFASEMASGREEERMAKIGMGKDAFDKLDENDKKKAMGILNNESMSLKEKKEHIRELHKDHIREHSEGHGRTPSENVVDNLADRRAKAAIAHGNSLQKTLDAEEANYMARGGKVFDDEGNAIGYREYIDGQDARAASVAERFQAAHPELISARQAAGVLGASMMGYGLFIHRSDESMANSLVHGSTESLAAIPASKDAIARDTIAADENNIPIGSQVAQAHAAREKEILDNNSESPVGMPSDNQPVDAEKINSIIARDNQGNAVSSFIDDDISQAGEALSGGNPTRGSIAPVALTESDGEVSIDDVRTATQPVVTGYASGVSNQEFSDMLDNQVRLGAVETGITEQANQGMQAAAMTSDVPLSGNTDSGMPAETVSDPAPVVSSQPQEPAIQNVTHNVTNEVSSPSQSTTLPQDQTQEFSRAMGNIMGMNDSSAMSSALSATMGGLLAASMTRSMGSSSVPDNLSLSNDAAQKMSSLSSAAIDDLSRRVGDLSDEMKRNSYIQEKSNEMARLAIDDMKSANKDTEKFVSQRQDELSSSFSESIGDAMREAAQKQAEDAEAKRRSAGGAGIRDKGSSGKL